MNAPGPFRKDDAPGRIPDSLIDAVLDGAVDDRTRREVSQALRHDATRRRDVRETMEAIEALRSPIETPDFSQSVLTSLDRKHRFLPARARRAMRQTRLGIGLAALLALGTVAVTQRAIPRLASLGNPSTPVSDVAQALTADAETAAGGVREGARVMQASVPFIPTSAAGRKRDRGELTLDVPGDRAGRQYRFEIDRGDLGGSLGGMDLSSYRMVTLDGGHLLLIETPSGSRPVFLSGAWGAVSRVSLTYGWQGESTDKQASEPDSDADDRGGWVAEELP